MAKARPSAKPANRRGSPEAIEKRRVARAFNDLLGGSGASGLAKLDGRTEKRRKRLLRELEQGKAHGGRDLKPLDVLQRVNELLELGETVAAVKKVRPYPPVIQPGEETGELVQRLHQAYGFRHETYRFVGIVDEVLIDAGIIPGTPTKRGSRKRRAA